MEINIENPTRRFEEHLQLPNNERILFSGKFGTGKSHFLKKYFETQSNKYNVFWISPVNYVVGANQDIFEWIKVDIAKTLLQKYLIDSKQPFSSELIRSTYLAKNFGELFAALAEALANYLPSSGTLSPVLSLFRKQVAEFKKFEKSAKEEEQSDFSKLARHISAASEVKGSIFEDDLVTQIIRAAIQWVDESTGKSCVLVIDDLDRIDPEHIFRILNIFSAHSDHFDSNKFGLSTVVLVCDINNIEHLFRHRYGTSADFEGYIEKYYTYYPFQFSIASAIVEFCKTSEIISCLDDDNRKLIAILLGKLFESNLLKVRNLKKIHALDFRKTLPKVLLGDRLSSSHLSHHYQYFQANSVEIDFGVYDFFKVVYVLSMAFGSYRSLMQAVQSLQRQEEIVDLDDAKCIVNSMCMTSYICQTNRPKVLSMVVNMDTDRHPIYGNMKDSVFPVVTFLAKSSHIPLVWSRENPYKNGHYFQLYQSMDLAYSKNGIELKNIRWGGVWSEVNRIISFVQAKNFFENVHFD